MAQNATRILVIRHGQTEWNRVERFRGRAEVPLNDTGRAQAAALARRLAGREAITTVFASPLERCVQTAEAIAAQTGARVEPREGLNDVDYGQWQGLTPDEVRERWPREFELWLTRMHEVQFPGGDNLTVVRERVVADLERIRDENVGQTVAIVSHKVICQILACAMLGLDNAHVRLIELDNASLSIFSWQAGEYIVEKINDTCHLDGLS